MYRLHRITSHNAISSALESDDKHSSRCRIPVDGRRAGRIGERSRVVAAIERIQQVESQSRGTKRNADSRVETRKSTKRDEILVVDECAALKSRDGTRGES